ncbi:hypothetical protein [Streptomyces sp. S1D4-14]|uniref:hypothetical protein n=1 Tax=Streptomyces sp. S1D4-14 TaxID=2594461 RepID=UPI0011629D84|nr:hypothetical protein [Streptomyces sp. S1D4-14]QDN64481.1 hypothetical protein FNV66_01205 [Streptomyces sp. S1D4-14]
MAKYRVSFARIGREFNVAPLVTEASDRTELELNIGDYVNSSRTAQRNREVIGGGLDANGLGGYLLSEAGENYGTFTVVEL